MNSNKFEIFLETYHYALINSISNENWYEKINDYPEILSEYFKTKHTREITGDSLQVENLILFRRKNKLPYIPKEIFDSNKLKPNVAKSIINNVFQKTSYFAHMIRNLLDEFGNNKRKFNHYKITPYPEKDNDTYFPIKKFKISSNNSDFVGELIKNGMIINNSDDDDMKDYFINRCMSKNLKVGYLDDLPNFNGLKRKLVFVKFLPLNSVKSLSIHPKKIKVRYLGNQTVRNENYEYPISDEGINVLHLEKLS